MITVFGPGANNANAVAIQADGKIVAAGLSGFANDFALARYNRDGSLDESFGTGGKVTTDFGRKEEAYAVAIQVDGKIVAAGRFGGSDFALARYNYDGSLDASFGNGGKVTTNFGLDDVAWGVAIQADGKIVAGGEGGPSADFALARYNADGSLDESFGTAGQVMTDFGGYDRALAIALQTDGRIVAAGKGDSSDDFALARYNVDGNLDESFGTGGKVLTDFGGLDTANGVAIQRDGKIVVAGNGNVQFALARYNVDGNLDESFNGDGKLTTQFAYFEWANAVAIQHNGKIVAAGFASLFNSDMVFALARYNEDGSLDMSFGTGGKVMTDFGVGSFDVAHAVAIQANGKIVAAGGAGLCTPPCAFALVRYRLPRAVDRSQ